MSTSEMKQCPYCGEEIRSVAVKCRYCQSMLDGSGQVGGSVASGGARAGTGPGSAPVGSGGAGATGGASHLGPGVVLGAGRYELQQLLGKGGMGEVYLAEHTYTGQKVALKAVWPNLMASEGPRKRFLQEGRVLAKLKHPNIVGLTDFFEEDGRFFLVMEYVEGETLSAYLHRASGRGESLSLSEFARVVGGVLKGLSHAHAQTPFVVHRDIKPANVMLAKDGRVVLMDFGIARVAGGEKLTNTTGVVGTYEYMSPEQVSGQAITPATDVYAVGILAYELLTGDVPFPQKSDSGYEAMEGHRYKTPPPIQERRPDCPPALVAWVEKALAKEPGKRFADASSGLLGLPGMADGPQANASPKPGHYVGGGPGRGRSAGQGLAASLRGDELSGYVRIAPGRFIMGSPPDEEGRFDDETQHEVTLTRGFLMKRTPVTNREWFEVIGRHTAGFASGKEDHPVVEVSWWDALAYCNELSQKEGLEPCYEFEKGFFKGPSGTPGVNFSCKKVRFLGSERSGYRLPTESEWEYAVRAGSKQARYGKLDEVAWYDQNSAGVTHAVGRKAPNEWGLYDMLGNVWEWCWDWYERYQAELTDPVGGNAGSFRVYRGGGWNSLAGYVRAASRFWNVPGYRSGGLGFRLCRSQ